MTELQSTEVPFTDKELALANYIMLHRVYDLLAIIALSTDEARADEIIDLHEQGMFFSAPPSAKFGNGDEYELEDQP